MSQAMRTRLTRQLHEYLYNSHGLGQILPKITNPTPFYVSNKQLLEWSKLHRTLHASITNISHDFNSDRDVQSILNLSPRELSIISKCNKNHANYNVGSFRPDLLIEQQTQKTKICEINARFAVNAYMITSCLSNCLPHVNHTFKGYNYPKYNEMYSTHFDFTKHIFIIKGKEYGNDIYLFKLFNETIVHIININDVIYNEKTKKLYTYVDSQPTEIRQIILELHQNEILSLPKGILETFCAMSANQTLLNDFRTIFMVHNKKFLKILSNPYIMQRYIDREHAEFLQDCLLKSYCELDIINNQQFLDELIENKDNYILKPTLLGKGEGIIFGDECTKEEWHSNIKDLLIDGDEYIVQEYIKQELFEFDSVIQDKVVKQNMIPTLLCYNDQFYGPGIIRSSPERLIAVSRGGEILLPQIMDDKYMHSNFAIDKIDFTHVNGAHVLHNNDVKINIDSFDGPILEYDEDEDIQILSENIMNILKTDHRCLLKINEDEESMIMQNIVNEIGIPHIHDKNNTVLWDVKVMNDSDRYIARSHGHEEFELHTDASFDMIIPRYFGLHVIHEDKLNGGLNQLISIDDDVITKLTQDEIDKLLDYKFKIKIPGEFIKNDGVEYNYGTLLSFDNVLNKYIMRYRKDIICRNDLDEKQKSLLNKLENVFQECQNDGKLIKVPENSILFVDNCCYLHSRTQIKDQNRHLRRIRFHPKQSNLIPNFN